MAGVPPFVLGVDEEIKCKITIITHKNIKVSLLLCYNYLL